MQTRKMCVWYELRRQHKKETRNGSAHAKDKFLKIKN